MESDPGLGPGSGVGQAKMVMVRPADRQAQAHARLMQEVAYTQLTPDARAELLAARATARADLERTLQKALEAWESLPPVGSCCRTHPRTPPHTHALCAHRLCGYVATTTTCMPTTPTHV